MLFSTHRNPAKVCVVHEQHVQRQGEVRDEPCEHYRIWWRDCARRVEIVSLSPLASRLLSFHSRPDEDTVALTACG